MRHFPALIVVAISLLPWRLAWAADAYDDENEVERPESSSFDDEEEDSDAVREKSLETGGLQAPDALGETGDKRSDIEKELDESDEKDSGRGLEFAWLGAEAGFQSVGLETFGSSGLLPAGLPSGDGKTSASGLMFGGGAGLRVLYFTLGARFRYANFADFNHWSLLGEAALRVPLGKLEPYVTVGAGYAAVGGISGTDHIGGLDLRLGAGLDYYLSHAFSVGAQLGGDALFLSGSDGSSTGAALTGTALVGLHF